VAWAEARGGTRDPRTSPWRADPPGPRASRSTCTTSSSVPPRRPQQRTRVRASVPLRSIPFGGAEKFPKPPTVKRKTRRCRSYCIETAGAAPRSTAVRAMATTARRKKAEALLDAVGGDVSKAIRAGKSTELPLRGGARRAGHRRILLGGGGGGAVVNPPPSRPRPSVHPSYPSQSPTQISNPPAASIAQSTSSATTSRRSRPR
jgi:hypothetical protein